MDVQRMARGEAVVVFVIKLLEDAIRDGDKIYATVIFQFVFCGKLLILIPQPRC
jgi:acyl transferase domain-containing protein